SLTDAVADHLYDVLRELRKGGTTILYVSHRLPEVFRLCDRITVLRDGALVSTVETKNVSTADIVRAMVGRDLARSRSETRRSTEARSTEATLQLTRLCRLPAVRDISLAVRRGEIVGLFGLVGSGRSELLETIFGLHQPTSGSIALDGNTVSFRSPRDAARAGIVLVPEERH